MIPETSREPYTGTMPTREALLSVQRQDGSICRTLVTIQYDWDRLEKVRIVAPWPLPDALRAAIRDGARLDGLFDPITGHRLPVLGAIFGA